MECVKVLWEMLGSVLLMLLMLVENIGQFVESIGQHRPPKTTAIDCSWLSSEFGEAAEANRRHAHGEAAEDVSEEHPQVGVQQA